MADIGDMYADEDDFDDDEDEFYVDEDDFEGDDGFEDDGSLGSDYDPEFDEDDPQEYDEWSDEDILKRDTKSVCASTAVERSTTFLMPQEPSSCNDVSNSEYSPVEFKACEVVAVTSDRFHSQTCDSCCCGPEGTVMLIGRNSRQATRSHAPAPRNHDHIIKIVSKQPGNFADGPVSASIPLMPQQKRSSPASHQRADWYSIRSDASCRHLAAVSNGSRLQFWQRQEQATAGCSTSPDAPDGGHPFTPAGSILIPSNRGYLFRGIELTSMRHMLNCVRMGLVAGRQRAVVAGQNEMIYIFNLPESPENRDEIPASSYLCSNLRSADDLPRLGSHSDEIGLKLNAGDLHHELRHCTVILDDRIPSTICQSLRTFPHVQDEASLFELQNQLPVECVGETVVIGRMGTPINSAEPSPDGNWMSVLTDNLTVTLLPEALNYKMSASLSLPLDPRLGSSVTVTGATSTAGCQYCAWSSDSRFLAVSSDYYHSVTVWEIAVRNPSSFEPEPLGQTLAAAAANAAKHRSATDADSVDKDSSTAPERTASPCDAPGRNLEEQGGAATRQHGTIADMGRALWALVSVESLCTYAGHQHPCLALAFVPALPTTLVWLEEKVRVHISDVRLPDARRVICMHALPMQIGLARRSRAELATDVEARERIAAAARLRASAAPAQLGQPRASAGEISLVDMTDKLLHAWRERHCTTTEQNAPFLDSFPSFDAIRDCVYDVAPPSIASPAAVDWLQGVLSSPPHDKACMEAWSLEAELAVTRRVLQGVRDHAPVFTGLAVVGDTSIAISSAAHVATLEFVPSWSKGCKWPPAFNRAVQQVLMIARFGRHHVPTEHRGTTSLWNLPTEIVDRIIKAAAGQQSEWMGVGQNVAEGQLREVLAGGVDGFSRDDMTSSLMQRSLAQVKYNHMLTVEPRAQRLQSRLDTSTRVWEYLRRS